MFIRDRYQRRVHGDFFFSSDIMLPPGVKYANTFLPHQNGIHYTTPKIDEKKRTEKQRTTGFEEDEHQPEIIPNVKPKIVQPEASKGKGSSFPFITNQKPISATPPKEKEKGTPDSSPMSEKDSSLEQKVIADYLQPGGARLKLSKEEKTTLLFKVKNLNKTLVSKAISEFFHPKIENTRKIKAINVMDALLENPANKYKEEFIPYVGPIKEMLAIDSIKSVHPQIRSILTTLTGSQFAAIPAQSTVAEPNTTLFDIDVKKEPQDTLLTLDFPESNPKNVIEEKKTIKLDPFKMMTQESTGPKGKGLFGSLEIRTNPSAKESKLVVPPSDSVPKPVSSFSFLRKGPAAPTAQTGTASTTLTSLEGLQFDDIPAVVSNPKANSLLDFDFKETNFSEPISLNRGPIPHYHPEFPKAPLVSNEDKYFGFVEEELYGKKQKHHSDSILTCLLYTSPSPRDATLSRMPSSA
eukprot:TRINITY_DN11855_c0_g1_i1.p1 TRINITY_DN11855_c0_g1~~TRINITY_DN11855_c0_g1_i1.p1  ORF type:complete len:466 (+),score=124.01 TRINITY_DN11855_c0_g1_i1:75-1472(+)